MLVTLLAATGFGLSSRIAQYERVFAAQLTPVRTHSLNMVTDESNRPPPELPPQLEEWGCDADLWSQVRKKRSLIKLAEGGDEERFRARVAKLRQMLTAAADAEPPPAAKASPHALPRIPNAMKKSKDFPVRKEGPYKLFGKVWAAIAPRSRSCCSFH